MNDDNITWPAEYNNLPDDFADDKDIQQNRQQLKEEADLLDKNIGFVKSQLNLIEAAKKPPGEFYLLTSLGSVEFQEFLISSSPFMPLQVIVIEYYSSVHAGKYVNGGDDKYFIGLITLKTKYPDTLVTPETFADKMANLVTHSELNFDDCKKFSTAFYVLTKDKEKLTMLFNTKDLDLLAELKELEIEIKDNQCLFRTCRSKISQETAEQFCQGASLLNKVLNC